MEQFQKHIDLAVKSLKLADHMTYVTFPLIQEHRLLIKIFDEIYKTIINSINAILHYECLYKRIRLYNNHQDNLQTFLEKSAKNYDLSNEQIRKIKEIIDLNRKHKQSAMEFVKKDKIVILSDNLGTQTIDLITIKEYLLLSKELVVNINKKMNL